MSMKNPLTPAGVEPATFRFVAQHLNHCATVVPFRTSRSLNLQAELVTVKGKAKALCCITENTRILTMRGDFVFQCTYGTVYVVRGCKERMSGIPCIAAEAAAYCIIYT